jgi:hypothetical protein
MEGRDPDFLIIGAMKAGTTSLFRWLESVDGVELPEIKELNFFSGQTWDRGLQWYRSQFPDDARVTGEASPSYSSPSLAELASVRIHELLPDVPLLFSFRDPVERARSHYRHQVQRGRERRTFPEAVGPESDYVMGSLYSRALGPYLRRFPAHQLLVLRFEQLTADAETEWQRVLAFLGLPDSPRPEDVHNVTNQKRRYSRVLLRLWESGSLPRHESVPRVIRRLGKLVMTSDSARYRTLLSSSQMDLPAESMRLLEEDQAVFRELTDMGPWRPAD